MFFVSIMKSFINQQVSLLPPSGIRKFFDLVISAGPEVISLGVGEPDFPTPWHIREAVIFALEKGFTNYSENAGLFELREEIAKKTFADTKQKYDPAMEILVTSGVSEGMDLVFRAIINPGEKVYVPNPAYVMYEPLVRLAGGEVEFYDPLNVFDLKISGNVKAIVLNFPGNPVGNTFSEKELKFIAEIAEKHDLLVLSDEIYGGMSFQQLHKSFIELFGMKERTILFNGLSKTHSMTGFRVGWACGPSEVIGGMTKIHQYSALCAPTLSQVGAIEALRKGDVEAQKMNKIFDQRRKYCISRLEEMKMNFHRPKGAFYIFVDISSLRGDDVEFCEELLKKEKLAVVPGSVFGSAGRGYVRMTYAASEGELREAFDRFGRFISFVNAAEKVF